MPPRDALTAAFADVIEQASERAALKAAAAMQTAAPLSDDGERLIDFPTVCARLGMSDTYVHDTFVRPGLLTPILMPGRGLRRKRMFRQAELDALIRRLAGVRVLPDAEQTNTVRPIRSRRGGSPKRHAG